MLRNWAKVYIWRLLIISFMESSIPISSTFTVFHLVRQLLQSLFVDQYIVWVESLISEMYRSLLIIDLYLRSFSFAIYEEFDQYCFYLSRPCQYPFLFVRKSFKNSLQIMSLISDHLILYLWVVLILKIF